MIQYLLIRYLWVIVLLCPLHSFTQKESLSFLALGDSYTIGTSETPENSWPMQLAKAMAKKGINLNSPTIIAGAGWTTDKLISEIESSNLDGEYDLVSLLIGVNNQYRGLDIEQFKVQFKILLDKSVSFAGNDPSKVFVLSIPDWGVMPFAGLRDKEKITREIGKYNAIIKKEVSDRKILYFEITKLSRQAIVDKTLIAPDGLHPSKKMYKTWVKKILKNLVRRMR